MKHILGTLLLVALFTLSQNVNAQGPSVGQIAPDISMQSPDGKTYKLSDLRGKIVLIDFWASWCGPCRRENPNVVRAYNKYKHHDFTVYGVSLDQTKVNWQNAIAKDKLSWPYHVSDLKGWSNAAAAQYRVRSIPTNYVIDRTGKIVAKNLRGTELDRRLAIIIKDNPKPADPVDPVTPTPVVNNSKTLPKASIDGLNIAQNWFEIPFTSVDAAFQMPDSKYAYLFSGDRYVKWDMEKNEMLAGYPKKIKGNWSGLPYKKIDAAFYSFKNKKVYMFSGDSYVRFDPFQDKVDSGYPRKISSGWPSGTNGGKMLSTVDGAIMYPNGKIYFMKGTQYVRYDWDHDMVDANYPRSNSTGWKPIQNIDAVLNWQGRKAIIFNGNKYYRWDIKSDKIDK